ncbi:hypothetical protein DKX38_017721 [Salix brachista]|uniref:F-box domain-containing protein n=1 Tax=Salix brachista TaxID=2182728 RepID=A0A5N5KVZ4_9ROSI|nr:hypothetical protein DKX38_017721 [Salix brachista]
MTDYLLEVVMQEILLRLPIESLIKCTSVCMSWYSLVSSTAFISIRSISLDKDDPFYLTSHLLKRGRRTLLSLEPVFVCFGMQSIIHCFVQTSFSSEQIHRQLLVDLVLRGKQLTLLVPLWKVWCYLTKQMQQVMEMIQMLWNSDTD